MTQQSHSNPDAWQDLPLRQLCREHPQVEGFLSGYLLDAGDSPLTLRQLLSGLDDEHFEDIGCSRAQLIDNLNSFMQSLQTLAGGNRFSRIESLTILGGRNKSGLPEQLHLDLVPGSVTSIVGPTGSGKSRLLADIEWMAQGDTPTRRHILINGQVPDRQLRFSLEHKLVAQLSQNMNFVMDTSAGEFIAMHAESRMRDPARITRAVIDQANRLAGEAFSHDTPVTALSGGQSRALMIADTAFLSSSPVVLIDEVENAGIDRKKALELLVGQNKIVLMSTHDPILALMGQQRLVIKNGGVARVIRTTDRERSCLTELQALDNRIQSLRERLRGGDLIETV